MATIRCHKCQHENPGGRGFCQECGTRLVSSAPPPPDSEQTDLDRLKKLLAASERDVAKLEHDLEAAKRDHDMAIGQATAQARREAEAWNAEETRLKQHLSESAQALAELEKKLETRHSEVADVATQHEHRFKESQAEAERAIASLKQEHDGVIQRLAADHQGLIAQKDKLYDVLKKDFEVLEQKFANAPVGPPDGARPDGVPASSSRRQFSPLVMSIVATLFAGAGGAGGYFFHGSTESGAPKTDQAALISESQNRLNQSEQTNQGLRDELRSSREAYEKLDQESKEQLRAQAAGAGAGSSDEVRKLEATNKDIQQRLNDTATELDRSNQRVAEDEKTITQLNLELQDLKSQAAKPRETKSQDSTRSQDQKEAKPRPRRASDFESTIRNLEREYGRDVGVPWYAR
jgi:chromosome segregation ATPase